MPADLTGSSVFRPDKGTFEYVEGPIFHSLVLVDEINRAPPKVQSALLEAMAEHQVTAAGVTHMSCPSRSWWWRRKTRSSTRARSRCPRRSSTASC